MTAGRREVVDTGEEMLLRGRGQIDEQPLREPGRGRQRVETALQQRMRPVVAQVDGDLAALGSRLFAPVHQHLTFELQHLRLIELEDHRAVGPCQSVSTRIQDLRPG